MESKFWHNLTDVAYELSCEEAQLVKLMQKHKKPLYVIPSNWYAHIWTQQLDDNHDQDDTIIFSHETFKLSSDKSKPAYPNEPLPLSSNNIQVLAIKGVFSEDIFVANDAVKSDGSVMAYYKLCDSLDYKQNYVAHLSFEDIVVRDEDFKMLEKIVLETPFEKPISDNQKDKLYRVIGSLTLLISTKTEKYSNSGKPNFTNISADILKTLKDTEKDNNLETLGLSDTNLRTAMSDGIKLLYGKKI